MPAEFQQAIDRTLENTPGTFAFLDILICPKGSDEHHWSTVNSVLEKLNANNVGLNLDKCEFLSPEINWFGFALSAEGATPLNHKLDSIKTCKLLLPANNFGV